MTGNTSLISQVYKISTERNKYNMKKDSSEEILVETRREKKSLEEKSLVIRREKANEERVKIYTKSF